ncbi:hypothetical protein B566_EDAN013317 [Ephemera danica]|nr:hypothetical protein B566_EDAN013317 [Ephemera danica]
MAKGRRIPHDHASRRPLTRRDTIEEEPSSASWNFSHGWMGAMLVAIAVAGHFCYQGYLETRVTTPFDAKKMVVQSGLDVPRRYWGSYRPGVYFGMKTREPFSPVMGLMWYSPRHLQQGAQGIRHWCEQGDNLERYGWLEHDGIYFGEQELRDGPLAINTSFVKRPGGLHGGDWSARIRAVGEFPQEVALLFYTAIDEKTEGWIKPTQNFGVHGYTSQLGGFTLSLDTNSPFLHQSQLITWAPGLHQLRETVLSSLRWSDNSKKRYIILPGHQMPVERKEPNFIITQLIVNTPFELDVVFESSSNIERPSRLVGAEYSKALDIHKKNFQTKFKNIFKLEEKGYNGTEIQVAQAAFSNLLGGIGYFYGSSLVSSKYTTQPMPYWKAPLYTAVPSRSFFPRGFLWDEGFHELLVAVWDLDISLDVMTHWFDLMNIEGWIPREQILGVEARAKVPDEFVVQKNANANPPTILLTLDFILSQLGDKLSKDHIGTVRRMWPRLQAWFEWYNTTQLGDVPGSYRWRGRDPEARLELNPKTLTSGLDDYPRASHPNNDERHLDLRCWMAAISKTMARLATLTRQPPEEVEIYEATYAQLTDPILLDRLHWSDAEKRYADFGLHTDAVKLKRKPKPQPPGQPPNPKDMEMVRVVTDDPDLRLVDTTFGYVSLFPLLLRLLPPDSLKLGILISDVRKPELLWTKYGLRSLGTTSPLYMKRNTEQDAPYWRGPIWININFLAVKALYHYASVEGPYQDLARSTYSELRKNLVDNVIVQYKKTGFIWEQYNDKTGQGQGSRPFNGWSSLVVLMMADIY